MRAELVSFTASVLINASILFSFDHAARHYDQTLVAEQKKIAKKSTDFLSFEFVEAPAKTHARRPVRTQKISDRDALNQDQTRNKTLAQSAPRADRQGPADQLAQKQGQPSKSSTSLSAKVSEKLADLSQQPASSAPESSPKQTAAQKSAGQSRIATFETSKMKSTGAQLYGMTSFEATGSGMGKYMKNLKEKIWIAWFPYLAAHYPKDFKTADAVVSFKLNANGEVKIVQLIDSKGSALFAAFCMESVQRAGSFGPLPPEILDLVGKDELEIKFAFHYW